MSVSPLNCFSVLVSALIRAGYHICAAESCTGGLFSAGIVSVADASKVLDRSFVTYSKEAKAELVGVSVDTIREYGVVSENTATEMAVGASRCGNAQVGVGITGFAGPGGGDRFAKLGTVCFGFCINGKTYSTTVFYGNLSRNEIREKSAVFACETLIELLSQRNEL